MTPIWVIGAGGHAKVVIDTLRAAGKFDVAGVFDDDPGRLGTNVLGVPVIGDASAASVQRLGVVHAIVAVGFNQDRARLVDRLTGLVSWAVAVHPHAHVSSGVRVGPGTIIFAGAVVQPDAAIGAHVILNTSTTVDHDCVVDDFAHLAPGVHLAGDVSIGAGTLLGLGSVVLPGRSVGPWTTVGAGAVVSRDLPGGVTAKGIPARPEGRRLERRC